jgi:hypothetical protein
MGEAKEAILAHIRQARVRARAADPARRRTDLTAKGAARGIVEALAEQVPEYQATPAKASEKQCMVCARCRY